MSTQQQQHVVIDCTGTEGHVWIMGGVFDMAELCALAQLGVSGLRPDAVVADVGGMVVYTDTGGGGSVVFVFERAGNRTVMRADAVPEYRVLCRAAASAIVQAGPGVTLKLDTRINRVLMEREMGDGPL